ncbi:hypothetical protein SHVI106290_14565 [Shewanella violacea]|uniref:Uncharacterized protein n=1 Tax=Shewanella violacea (strain JCM 10179 / CIP 106290 / LMG 19151 / DSS12) TaxID=637905 RepID=D4ZBM5_SHEVD|nr:hypothetical protein SVI_3449 [Shewanella violacea DSS12]
MSLTMGGLISAYEGTTFNDVFQQQRLLGFG